MRKVYFYLIVVFSSILTSCFTYDYYQICKVSSELTTSKNGAYEYKNDVCNVTYDFWTNGGAVSFVISNNSDDIIYVDLAKSFLIKNGIAYDYFLNRTISSSSSIVSSQSSGLTGTAFGYWLYYGKIPGSITNTSTNLIGAQKTISTCYEERPIVAIPPYSSKRFCEYKIMINHFVDCDLYESPSKKEYPTMLFNYSNSPVNFTNYICYHIGDDSADNFIKNNFYISEITNQHFKATIYREDVGCLSDYHKTKENVFIRTSPKEFYIIYTPREQIKDKTKATKTVKKQNR